MENDPKARPDEWDEISTVAVLQRESIRVLREAAEAVEKVVEQAAEAVREEHAKED